MEVLILDENFLQVCLIDTFESLIWTERYFGCGNFELYTPDISLLRTIRQDYYAWLKGSDQVMVIEEIQIGTEVEIGGRLTISGRSLESILDRRIIWKQTILNGDLQNGIRKLLEENVISPSIVDRRIAGFLFMDSNDPAVRDLTIRAQYTGDNLYETIETICKAYELGFQVTLNEQNQFVFTLYAGADRSFDQSLNPHVIFSPKFENILNSNYLESKKTLKNVALVAGENEMIAERLLDSSDDVIRDSGSDRIFSRLESNANKETIRRTWVTGLGKDLQRRELYTDARDLQSETEES